MTLLEEFVMLLLRHPELYEELRNKLITQESEEKE